MSAEDWHTPVMLADILGTLAPRADATYLDATFGAGGCAKALLEAARCTVFGIDRDPEACARTATLCRRYGGRLVVLNGRFGDMQRLLGDAGIDRVDGVAFDLGTSSMQLDAPERGFSFRADGPLDMRMDPESGVPAADVVNHAAEGELTRILSEFGEERAARRVARAIVAARRASPITGTARLAEIVRTVLPWRRDTIDPATRTFQALRIHVNDELGELDRGLIAAERLLKAGGRLCVVAFHSLEDRKVKTFLRTRSGEQQGTSRHRPDLGPATAPSFRLLHKRAVRPSAAEVAANPRARSARLRAAERTTAAPWPEPERRAA